MSNIALWKSKRRKKDDHIGHVDNHHLVEMVLINGSHHTCCAWLEDGGLRLVLLDYEDENQ